MGTIKDDLNQAWEYWSRDGAVLDAVDAVGFAVSNPVTVAKATYEGADFKGHISEDISDAGQVIKDAGSFVLWNGAKVVGGLAVLYLAVNFASGYASAKGASLGT